MVTTHDDAPWCMFCQLGELKVCMGREGRERARTFLSVQRRRAIFARGEIVKSIGMHALTKF
jgi:hypothetical protein